MAESSVSPIATLEYQSCKAEIYETALPGKFVIRYLREDGSLVGEESLTGVSTYKQREREIEQQLARVAKNEPIDPAALADPGEY